MLETPRILAFAGSLRTGSFNKRLAIIAAEAARSAGAQVTLIDLLDFPLPVLNQDDEDAHGLPENAKKLKALFRNHHGLLIASPEYNSSISGVLKNTIDWVSRSESDDEPSLVAYKGKTCALISASPGGLGGMRALVHVRSILTNIGVFVLPGQVSISNAAEAFVEGEANAFPALKDARKQAQVQSLARELVETTRRLEPPTR
jgi:chromate reductase